MIHPMREIQYLNNLKYKLEEELIADRIHQTYPAAIEELEAALERIDARSLIVQAEYQADMAKQKADMDARDNAALKAATELDSLTPDAALASVTETTDENV